ncbi:MAG: amidohydrolase/deacetylase family metallohydrolase [Chloroflexi bacterium]|nr:amidohydrolase/deacetylase family metallohydrolase [Chloroflexota bacterium]
MYDLLVKGGTVIDPAQKLHRKMDVGITAGKIAALGPDIATKQSKRVIDAKGLLVTAGIIEFHCHCGDGLYPNAIAPDDAGVLAGVTTVCDGGTAGYANFPIFRRFVIPQARSDVFCFLNLGSTGLAVMPEIWDWRNINTDEILKTIEKNRDIIKGLKIRATGSVAENLGVEVIRVAKKLARDAGLPLMVHVGIDPHEHTPAEIMSAFTREMLAVLDKGDIANHIYTWKAGGVIGADGTPLPEFRDAIERGVLLDTAIGRTQWDSEIARKAIDKGIIPTTITTDLNMTTMQGIVYSVIGTMSKFIALGLTLDQVVEMTTISPARLLREEGKRGKLAVDMPADVSILEPREGDFTFTDGAQGHVFKGKLLLVPKLTLKNGVEIEPGPRVADMVREFTSSQ